MNGPHSQLALERLNSQPQHSEFLHTFKGTSHVGDGAVTPHTLLPLMRRSVRDP